MTTLSQSLSIRTSHVGLTALAILSLSAPAHSQRGSAAAAGWVRDSVGAPVADADVSIVALRALTRTDSTGAFAFRGLDPGPVTLAVRRLGYAPRSLDVALRPAAVDSFSIALNPIPELLEAVRIGSPAAHHNFLIEEFYRRRARGEGVFITRDDIQARNATRLTDMVRPLPSIRLVRDRRGMTVLRFANANSWRREDCPPQYWIDGRRVAGFELDDFVPREVEGIELYQGPATTPGQFSSDAVKACGTVVIWSRAPLP